MAASPRRRTIRAVLGVTLVAALAGVALTVRQHLRPRPGVDDAPRPGAIAIKGFRHTSYDAAGVRVLLVTAGEVTVEPVRFGIFRLGFVSELTVTDVRVEALLRPDTQRSVSVEFARTIQAITGPGKRHGHTVARAFVRGLVLHLTNDGGEWVEITAARCETRTREPRLIALRNGVHLRTAAVDLAFEAVDYDTGSHRLVVPARTHPDEGRRAALEAANAALDQLL